MAAPSFFSADLDATLRQHEHRLAILERDLHNHKKLFQGLIDLIKSLERIVRPEELADKFDEDAEDAHEERWLDQAQESGRGRSFDGMERGGGDMRRGQRRELRRLVEMVERDSGNRRRVSS